MPYRSPHSGPGGGGYVSPHSRTGGGGGYVSPHSRSTSRQRRTVHHPSFWSSVAEPFVNTGKAVAGIGPGLYEVGKSVGQDIYEHPTILAAIAPTIAWEAAHGRNPFHHTYGNVVLPMGQGYARKYSPLIHGQFGKFAHRAFVEDPLGTALDALTLATLGAAAPVKAAKLVSDVGLAAEGGRVARLARGAPREVTVRSPGAIYQGQGDVITRGIHGTTLSRTMRVQANRLAKRYPELRVIGEHAQYGRALKARERRIVAGRQLEAAPHAKAYAKLSRNEQVAVELMHDFPSRRLLNEHKTRLGTLAKDGDEIAAKELKVISDPKVDKFFDNPTAKMHAAHAESAALSARDAEMLGLDPETVLHRRYQQPLLLRGAEVRTDMAAVNRMLERDLIPESRKGRIRQMLETPSEALGHVPGQVVHAADRGNFGKIVSVEGDTAKVHFVSPEGGEAVVDLPKADLTPIGRETVARRLELPQRLQGPVTPLEPEGRPIAAMIDEIRSELAQEGRPEPLYRPHESIETGRGTRIGAGGTSPRPQFPTRRSEGVLAAMGRVAHNTDLLTPQHMRVVRWATYKDRFQDLLRGGVKLPPGEPIPEGWQYLRRTPLERIPYTESTAGQFEQHLDELLGSAGQNTRELLTTWSREEAFVAPDGHRVIVPQSLVKQVTGEFERSNNALARFFGKSTAVWRALVLNLRVGWLVNNLVGNTLLYTVKTMGAGGLRAYLAAMSDLHGPEWVVRNLLNDKQIISHLTPEEMAALLPDQVSGTFFETQYTPARTKLGKAVTAPFGVLRHADIAYEQALRRALANQILRRSPEVRARLRAMPKESRSFREAAKGELADNPALVDRVSREINDALGQFNNMTPLEQRYLRGAAPFYAWYRAISLVMAKMPLDNPLRSNILFNLGKVGEQYQAPGYPYGGAIPIGPSGILKTAGVNPYGTLPQLVTGASVLTRAALGQVPGAKMAPVDLSEAVYAATGLGNPFLLLPFSGGLTNTIRTLPEMQVLFPRAPRERAHGLYTDYDRTAYLLAYLGVPVRHLRRPQG